MEKEKRERELAELRDRENRLDFTDLVYSGFPSNVLYFRMREEDRGEEERRTGDKTQEPHLGRGEKS